MALESLRQFSANTKQAIASLTGNEDWTAPPVLTMRQVETELTAITGEAAATTPPVIDLKAVNAALEALDATLTALIAYLVDQAIIPADWRDAPPPD